MFLSNQIISQIYCVVMAFLDHNKNKVISQDFCSRGTGREAIKKYLETWLFWNISRILIFDESDKTSYLLHKKLKNF